MTERTGLGVLEIAALEAIDAVAGTDGSVQSLQVLERLEGEGFGRSYLYEVMQDLVAPWQVHLPLIDGQGNFGSPRNDPAADPRYTEVALSSAGRLALAAERGQVGPVPIRLINGTAYCGGAIPPFAPEAVIRALDRLLIGDDAVRDAELTELVGDPVLPTGATVSGDMAALLHGERTAVEMSCRFVRGSIEESTTLEIVGFPLRGNPDEIADAIATRMREPRSGRGGGKGLISDLQDHSSGLDGTGLVAVLGDGVDVETAEAWLRTIWPVTVEVDWQLPTPMTDQLRLYAAAIRTDPSGLDQLRSLS